ncbi:MAG: N-acetylmuramoyl-L-alanine amidase [Clostridiales bacterium]|nr:N-acetylmuramoyl-L-alanine amidase [Clostridiales bacterium]
MYRLLKILSALALSVVIYGALLWHGPEVNRRAETIIWAEPRLDNIYIYGENAHFSLEPGYGEDVLLIKEKGRLYCRPAAYINRGLYLPELESGLYRLYAADLSVLAPKDFELTGYTITRGGQNLFYSFYSEKGRLVLSVEAVSALPEEVFDVIIDAGHGGDNSGATRRGREEKEENLRSSLYMAELFRAAGLKAALTRKTDEIPGQPGVAEADIDPYVEQGRVYLAYSTQAKYYISNHLNASAKADLRGWQLFRSVQADEAWQLAISAAFTCYGHPPNNSYPRLGEAGIYRRYSQDNEETGSDYYYILRETGGELSRPRNFSAAYPGMDLRRGAEGILVEYLFFDNSADLEYWDENWQGLVEAVADGCLRYWGIIK